MAHTVKEALFAEMLLDADKLIKELEEIKKMWPELISKATQEGINSASLSVKMNLAQTFEENGRKLRQIASESENALKKAQMEAFGSIEKISQTKKQFLILCGFICFLSSIIGVLVGYKLLNYL